MSHMIRKVGLAALSATLMVAALLNISPAQAESNGGVRVMPLGDSITDGFNVPGGYRIGLWQSLSGAGYKVDFVGSLFNGPGSLGDHDHEGHSGWTISQIDANVNNWLRNSSPRTILLHIGTNDMYGDTSGAPGRLGTLLDHITAAAPNADVFVATIVPSTGRDTAIRGFNAAIPGLVQSRANAGKHVHLVDMYSALTGSDLADGIHPNNTGYQKMANVWYNALRAVPGVIGDGATPPTTPPVTTPPVTTPPVTTPPVTTPPVTTPPATTPAAAGCSASYRMVNEWGSGLQGEVTVKNTGSGSISGWTVRMVLPGGSSVSNMWGGSASSTSGSIAVANSNYNGTLGSSSSATFGFLLDGSTAAPSITSCTSS